MKLRSQWDARNKFYHTNERVRAGIRAMRDYVGPDGISRKERNDCVPAAISFASGLPYWRVVDALREEDPGHRSDTGWYPYVYEAAMKRLGLDCVKELRTRYEPNKRGGEVANMWYRRPEFVNLSPTLAQSLDGEAREGRYLFSQRGHLIGVVDGVPHHCDYRNPATGRRARCQSITMLCMD